jgi:heterodisulfide reductase subunit C2
MSSSSTAVLSPATRVSDCYQCGKCTAGCPVAAHMDIPPSRIIRLLQLGYEAEAMRANSIWQCVSCQTCSTRCPKSVDCAGAMDALRQLSVERGTASPAQRDVVVFQRAFLDNVRRHGRLNEIDLMMRFKTEVFLKGRSLPALFRDATLAPELRKRRKLHLSGESVRDRAVVGRIFERTLPGASQ